MIISAIEKRNLNGDFLGIQITGSYDFLLTRPDQSAQPFKMGSQNCFRFLLDWYYEHLQRGRGISRQVAEYYLYLSRMNGALPILRNPTECEPGTNYLYYLDCGGYPATYRRDYLCVLRHLARLAKR